MSRVVIVGGVAIAALALIAATASAVLTSLMREGTETVLAANHVVRSAALIHEQLVALRDASAEMATADDREAELGRTLAEAKAQVTAAQERRLIETIEAKAREIRESGRLQEALAASDELVGATSSRAATVETRVRLWDVTGTIVGVVVAALTLLGVPAALFHVHRRFTQPMLRLAGAVRAFGAGDRSARAPSTGPAEFATIAAAFNELADTLARQDEERLAFLGGVAHDLRNPLNALRMSLFLVQPNRPLPNEAKLRDTFTLVTRQVTRLDRMLGDFLDAVRIQRGELDLCVETHDVRDSVRNTVELYANASHRHPISLSLPNDRIEVAADAMRVEQVLNNLVSNAIKYSPNGGAVGIAVRSDAHDAIIEVHDQGIGISRADQDGIFEPFRRNRGSNEMAHGVGLGLAVAHRIVEAHRGRIEIDSAPGRGSTFRVRLPLISRRLSAPRRGHGRFTPESPARADGLCAPLAPRPIRASPAVPSCPPRSVSQPSHRRRQR